MVLLPGKRLNHLLSRPPARGVFGDVEVNHLPTLVAQHDEHVQDSKSDRWYSEKVDATQVFGMIVEERPPVLGRWFTVADHVFGDSGLGDLDAQHAKLAVHARRTPEWVFPG